MIEITNDNYPTPKQNRKKYLLQIRDLFYQKLFLLVQDVTEDIPICENS